MKKLILDFKIQNNLIFVSGEDGAILTSLVANIKENSNLTQWQKNLLNIILEIKEQIFELDDVYKFKKELQSYYPNNQTIESSIRRNLQELRDLGLIQFYGNGKYRKLWI
jgi:Fe2+ or Zn2+ uptake regulation protein